MTAEQNHNEMLKTVGFDLDMLSDRDRTAAELLLEVVAGNYLSFLRSVLHQNKLPANIVALVVTPLKERYFINDSNPLNLDWAALLGGILNHKCFQTQKICVTPAVWSFCCQLDVPGTKAITKRLRDAVEHTKKCPSMDEYCIYRCGNDLGFSLISIGLLSRFKVQVRPAVFGLLRKAFEHNVFINVETKEPFDDMSKNDYGKCLMAQLHCFHAAIEQTLKLD